MKKSKRTQIGMKVDKSKATFSGPNDVLPTATYYDVDVVASLKSGSFGKVKKKAGRRGKSSDSAKKSL